MICKECHPRGGIDFSPQKRIAPPARNTETAVMLRSLLRPKVWIPLLAVAVLTALLWLPVYNAVRVAEVQGAVYREWDVNFNVFRPSLLPRSIDSGANALFERLYGHTKGLAEGPAAKTHNRHLVYLERFRAAFSGSIDDVDIWEPGGFSGDLGSALERFPELRRFALNDSQESGPSEAEWTMLCAKLRTLEHLEELEIGGYWLTDKAMEPLKGHPQLRSMLVTYGPISRRSIATLVSLPKLKMLHMADLFMDGERQYSADDVAAFKTALPGVMIKIDQDE